MKFKLLVFLLLSLNLFATKILIVINHSGERLTISYDIWKQPLDAWGQPFQFMMKYLEVRRFSIDKHEQKLLFIEEKEEERQFKYRFADSREAPKPLLDELGREVYPFSHSVMFTMEKVGAKVVIKHIV